MINFRRTTSRLLWGALCIYTVPIVLLLFLENRLVYPAPRYPSGDWAPDLDYEDVTFASPDGTRLHGWYFEHPRPRARVLFCHGNGEHVAYMGPELAYLRDELEISIFAFDYRGYGKSGGSPEEQGVLRDGHAAYRWLEERTGDSPAPIVLLGRSLGGAVALDIAATRSPAAVVLFSTFTCLPDTASRHYPWIPVHWLMRNRYDSIDKIRSYDGPLLQFHGELDDIVPPELGRRLHDACPSERKRFEILSGVGHNDIQPRDYLVRLREFLQRLETDA